MTKLFGAAIKINIIMLIGLSSVEQKQEDKPSGVSRMGQDFNL